MNIDQYYDSLWTMTFLYQNFLETLTVVNSPSVTPLVQEAEGAAAATHHTQHNDAQDNGSNHPQDRRQAI